MDYRKIYERVENSLYTAGRRFYAGFRLAASVLFLVVLIIFLMKFNIWGLFFASDVDWFVKAFFLLLITLMILFDIGYIIEGIVEIITIIHNSPDGVVGLMIFIRTIVNSTAYIAAGIIFVGFGVAIAVQGNIASSLFIILLGIFPIALGAYEVYKNYVFYKEFNTPAMEDPYSRYNRLVVIGENMTSLLLGTVLVLVFPMMIEICLATPDIDAVSGGVVIGMGAVFGIVGIVILFYAIKKIKN